jgi:hypothetical protein
MIDLRSRARAAFIHFGMSIVVASVVAGLVFLLWYPTPYREISGGRELFFIVIAVDVVLGPLITFAVFNLRKPRAELMRDLAIVVAFQLGGLAYGLHTVYIVRPVVLALEGDRLRVVRVMDLAAADLSLAPPELRHLSFWGTVEVATRSPRPDERESALKQGLEGRDLGMRPEFWRPAAETSTAFAAAARPLSRLLARHPHRAAEFRAKASEAGLSVEQAGYLPILARATNWSALVDLQTGRIVDHLAVDGF